MILLLISSFSVTLYANIFGKVSAFWNLFRFTLCLKRLVPKSTCYQELPARFLKIEIWTNNPINRKGTKLMNRQCTENKYMRFLNVWRDAQHNSVKLL